jgi:transcriptional regulator with XRE-family HTH domain
LLEKYGRMPSAAALARDFNFRAQSLEPITPETARRWLRGLSMPNFDRLRLLIDWLDMDPEFLGVGQSQAKILSGLSEPTTDLKINMHPTKDRRPPGLEALQPDEAELIERYRNAGQKSRRLLLSLAHALASTPETTKKD